jgi:hypothetical protein
MRETRSAALACGSASGFSKIPFLCDWAFKDTTAQINRTKQPVKRVIRRAYPEVVEEF